MTTKDSAGPLPVICYKTEPLFPHWDVKTKRPQTVKLDLPLFQCPSAGIIMSLPSPA